MQQIELLPVVLQDIVQKIVTADGRYSYKIQCTVYNGDYSFTFPMINRFDIVQDFEHMLCDYIEVDTMLQLPDFNKVTSHYLGLKATFSIDLTDPDSGETLNYSTGDAINILSNKELVVVIKNRTDVYKTFTPKVVDINGDQENISQQTLLPMTIQMYDPCAFAFRNYPTNGIFRNATVENIIYMLCHMYFKLVNPVKKLGIEPKIDMTPPDNTASYENFVIDPVHTPHTIFRHIQDRYGIYEKGIAFYYTGDIFFIYPKFDYNPAVHSIFKPVKIYFIGNDSLLGANRYHRNTSDGLEILINRATQVNAAGDSGSDTIGSAYVCSNGAKMMDEWFYTSETKNGTVHKQSVNGLIDKASPLGVIDANFVPKFSISYSNSYVLSEKLISYKYDEVQCVWREAVPFSIRPHQLIQFSSAMQSGLISTENGICSSVIYSFLRDDKSSIVNEFHTCNASLILKLAK